MRATLRSLSERPSHEPDSELVRVLATKFRWDQSKLASALKCFGSLPLLGQEELTHEIAKAYARFQNLGPHVETVADSDMRKQLREIGLVSRRLLRLLGVDATKILEEGLVAASRRMGSAEIVSMLDRFAAGDDALVGCAARMQLTKPDSFIVAPENRDAVDIPIQCYLDEMNRELGQNWDRCNQAILGLCWLFERSEISNRWTHRNPGVETHGGARRRRGQAGQLVEDALLIYAAARVRHPDSGPKPGIGRPMLNFTKACGELVGVAIDDEAIREIWRHRRKWGSSAKLF